MFWDRDRLLLALSTKKTNLSAKPQSHAGLLFKSYVDYYSFNLLDDNYACAHSIKVVPSSEFDLVVQVLEPAGFDQVKGQALIVHGYYDHSALYGHLARHLLEKGLRVVCFDLPGHGLSSGKRAAIGSFKQYQTALKSVMASQLDRALPTYLLGQSTGAAVLADLCSGTDMNELDALYQISSIVLLAPLLRPRSWRQAELVLSVLRGRKEYWPRSFKDNSHDADFVEFVKNKDTLQHDGLSVEWVSALQKWLAMMLERKAVTQSDHVSIIQGSEDETVDWKYNLKRYQTLFPESTTTLIDGAGHHLVCESQEYRDKLFSIIDRALPL